MVPQVSVTQPALAVRAPTLEDSSTGLALYLLGTCHPSLTPAVSSSLENRERAEKVLPPVEDGK